jgi:hypothetical protein
MAAFGRLHRALTLRGAPQPGSMRSERLAWLDAPLAASYFAGVREKFGCIPCTLAVTALYLSHEQFTEATR